MAAARRINLNRLFSSLTSSSSSNTTSKIRVIDVTPVRSEHTDRIINTATQQLIQENHLKKHDITPVKSEYTDRFVKLATQQLRPDQETVKKQEKDEIINQEAEAEEDENDDDDDDDGGGGGEYVNKETGEIGGPRGPEPTRFGDWERNGRCSDF